MAPLDVPSIPYHLNKLPTYLLTVSMKFLAEMLTQNST